MSRSLDKDILAQLQADDPTEVYKDISTILTDLPGDGLLEIEFLGKSHPLQPGVNYLKDGLAVAIPKLRLTQAFFVARQILQKHQKSDTTRHGDVLAATSVLLLMDPEHLTAANTRKRILISTLRANIPEVVLKREKQFVDSLLTSRLHRHTKSPTLWSHRRWILQLFAAHSVSIDLQGGIRNIVMVAGARHPRNYPAWDHARFLLNREPKFAESAIVDVKEFCLKNHTDISGWSFLAYTVSKVDDEENRLKILSSILAEVLAITSSLRWTNESVWIFLRGIVATHLISNQDYELFLSVNKKLALITPEDSSQWRTLDRAQRWCERYRAPTESNTAG
ncbi:hypothetical protein M426DRAFT_59160 [Hypoxylon sp. CI-4A]|nr:hypothetical protein M426DRAFT_59160 [Hypoxylon sp. CI-4A]